MVTWSLERKRSVFLNTKRNKIKDFARRGYRLAKSEFSTFVISTFGIFIYTFGVIGFTMPYHFPDSGVMGIALLSKYALGLSPALVNLAINAVLIILGARELSRRFVLWTIYNIFLVTLFLQLMSGLQLPYINDMFLVSVAGGIVKGLGIGIVFRTGTSGGGIDIVIAVLRKRYGIEVGKYSFYMNVVILGASTAIVGLEKVLFGFVASYISGQAMDHVITSFDKRRMVLIISDHADEDEIINYISEKLNRGCTILDSKGGYTKSERSTVMCLLTPRQTMELKRHLASEHPRSFMVITEASEVLGQGFKKWKNI